MSEEEFKALTPEERSSTFNNIMMVSRLVESNTRLSADIRKLVRVVSGALVLLTAMMLVLTVTWWHNEATLINIIHQFHSIASR